MNEIVVERPHLFEPNVYILVCAEISGNIDLNKMTAAVKQAYEANEATMSKIVLKDGISYYEKLSVSGCKVETVNENWLEIVKENERIPFAIDKGELVRTFIIPLKETTRILIMAHHLAGDGKSMVYFVKDIMNALSGNPLLFKPLTLVTRGSLPQKGLSLSAKLYTKYCKHKWDNRSYDWQDYYNLHNTYWNNITSDIQYETLSAEETQKIIEQSRQIGCSVNSYLVTMFLQKYQKKCEVGIPASIRQDENEAMSNLVSGIQIKYKYKTRKSFIKNAIQVHKKIARKLKKKRLFVLQFLSGFPMTLIDAVLLNKYDPNYYDSLIEKTAKVMSYTESTMRDIGITNLGILDIPVLYGIYKIENIIFVPPAVSYSNNIIGISTVNGKMTISYHNMIDCKKQHD